MEFLNFLYSLGMLLEFAAFIKLRIKKPDLHRPYKIPVETFGAVIICVPPTILLVLVMCLASMRTFIVSGSVMLGGFLLYPAIEHMRNKNCIKFLNTTLPPEGCSNTPQVQNQDVVDEASVSFLPDHSCVKKELQDLEINSNGILDKE